MLRLLVLVLVSALCLPTFANVLGDMQTFSPNTDGLDFISVHSSRIPTKGYLVLSGHLTYARNHLLVYRDLVSQERLAYKDQYADMDVNGSYSFSSAFEVSVSTNTITYQKSDADQPVDVALTRGLRTIRPGFKWNMDETNMWTVLGSVDFMNTVNNPFTGTSSKPIFNFDLVKGFKNDKVTHAFNLGYRNRTATDIPSDAQIFPLRDQATFSYGRSAPFIGNSRWVFELISAYPIAKGPYINATDITALDLLLGVKHRIIKNMNFDWGGTVSPGIRNLSPQARVFAGLVYYFDTGAGSSSNVKETKAGTLTISPADRRIEPGNSLQFTAEGGKPPYSYRLKSGLGRIDRRTGLYQSTGTENIAQIEVTDANKNRDTTTVDVRNPEGAGAPPAVMRFLPSEMEVYSGTRTKFTVIDGTAPYTFRTVSGGGSIDTNGYFTAPENEDRTEIEAQDAEGTKAIAHVHTKAMEKPDQVLKLENLNFHLDSDELKPSSANDIQRIIAKLKTMKISRMIIEGHTDSTGSVEHNFELSERRAGTVKRLLLEQLPLSDSQIEVIGRGSSRPIVDNSVESVRQKNRRVEILLYAK